MYYSNLFSNLFYGEINLFTSPSAVPCILSIVSTIFFSIQVHGLVLFIFLLKFCWHVTKWLRTHCKVVSDGIRAYTDKTKINMKFIYFQKSVIQHCEERDDLKEIFLEWCERNSDACLRAKWTVFTHSKLVENISFFEKVDSWTNYELSQKIGDFSSIPSVKTYFKLMNN